MNKDEKKITGYPHIDKPWMKYYTEEDFLPTENTNMVDFLKKISEKNKSDTAYEYYGKKVSYDELFNNADLASRTLSQIGVKKNDIIMYLVPNIPDEEEIWFGATQIGAISDFIDPRPDSMDATLNAKKVMELVTFEKPKYIVALDACYLGMISPIENELKEFGIEGIILLKATSKMTEEGLKQYLIDSANFNNLQTGTKLLDRNITKEELLKLKSVAQKIETSKQMEKIIEEKIKKSPIKIYKYEEISKECENSLFSEIKDENLANYIGHTSGTSGSRPKPIVLTNKNAISSITQCKPAGVGPEKGEKSLHVLPGFAPFGRYNNDLQTYYNLGTNIHVPEFVISEFGYLLLRYNPNTIMTPPAFLVALPNCEYLKDVNLSSLHKVIYGGDSMSQEDEEKLNEWLRKHNSSAIVEKGHGMSEYCGCGSYAKGEYNKYNSIGIPIPRTIYSLVDPDINDKLIPVKWQEGMQKLSGELVVSSEHVTKGMLHDNVIVPQYEMDGHTYIRTGDLAEMDSDGVFYINARKKRSFARLDGYKIKPYEIEKVIENNDNVKYAKIVPYYDERIKGIMPKCYVVLKEEKTLEEIKNIITQIVYKDLIENPTMSVRQIPAKFSVISQMPLTKNNKINFTKLESGELEGTEFNVDVNETNLVVENINIYHMEKNKTKVLKKIGE